MEHVLTEPQIGEINRFLNAHPTLNLRELRNIYLEISGDTLEDNEIIQHILTPAMELERSMPNFLHDQPAVSADYVIPQRVFVEFLRRMREGDLNLTTLKWLAIYRYIIGEIAVPAPGGIDYYIPQYGDGADAGAAPGADIPRGRAYEVHDAFARFQPFIPEWYSIIRQPDGDFSNTFNDFREFLETQIPVLFTEPELSFQLQRARVLFERCTFIPEDELELVGKTLSFVRRQPPEYKREYIKAFIQESSEAYRGSANEVSCTAGIRERIVLCAGSAAAILVASGSENPTYKSMATLQEIFVGGFNMNLLIRDWLDEEGMTPEVQALPAEEKKIRFTQWMRNAVREKYGLEGEATNNLIARYTRDGDNVALNFENEGYGIYGGKRKTKKSRKNKFRHIRKTKKGQKNKRSRKGKK
jgi:hypothetical protein